MRATITGAMHSAAPSTSSAIDLSRLQAPDVVEQIDYEVILAEMLAGRWTRWPGHDAPVESDADRRERAILAPDSFSLARLARSATEVLWLNPAAAKARPSGVLL